MIREAGVKDAGSRYRGNKFAMIENLEGVVPRPAPRDVLSLLRQLSMLQPTPFVSSRSQQPSASQSPIIVSNNHWVQSASLKLCGRRSIPQLDVVYSSETRDSKLEFLDIWMRNNSRS